VQLNDLISVSNPDCSPTGSANITRQLFQEGRPYTTVNTIDGSVEYVWDDYFIGKLLHTIEVGTYDSYSKKEKDVVDRYLAFQLNDTAIAADIVALDTKLGEM